VADPEQTFAGFVVGATTEAIGACTVIVEFADPEHPQELVAVTV
jgi:hypothetical protein